MSCYIVIPARLDSVRLPRKMLLSDTGKPLIQHTYEAAMRSKKAVGVCVATDSPELADVVFSFGGTAVMTGECRNGTERVAEAARHIPASVIVNLQGDEPDIRPQDIDAVIDILSWYSGADMATLAAEGPSSVRVDVGRNNEVLQFSRARGRYQHVGIYAYRKESLLRYAMLEPSTLELQESLEQFRAVQHGFGIVAAISEHEPLGINTRDDYDSFVARYLNHRGPQV